MWFSLNVSRARFPTRLQSLQSFGIERQRRRDSSIGGYEYVVGTGWRRQRVWGCWPAPPSAAGARRLLVRSPHVCLSALYEHGVMSQARMRLFRLPAFKIGTFEAFCVRIQARKKSEVRLATAHGRGQTPCLKHESQELPRTSKAVC